MATKKLQRYWAPSIASEKFSADVEAVTKCTVIIRVRKFESKGRVAAWRIYPVTKSLIHQNTDYRALPCDYTDTSGSKEFQWDGTLMEKYGR